MVQFISPQYNNKKQSLDNIIVVKIFLDTIMTKADRTTNT